MDWEREGPRVLERPRRPVFGRRGYCVVVILVGTLAAVSPRPAAGQACTVLPAVTDEVWFGGLVEFGGATRQRGGQMAANIRDVVVLEFGATWGGYEGAHGGAEARIRASTELGPGWPFCPYFEVRAVDYPFEDAFDLDYGDISEEAYHAGIGFGGVALGRGNVSLRWRANLGLYGRVWSLAGRRLVITGSEIHPEQVVRRDYSFHLSALGAVTLQWGRIAVSGGIANRPREGSDDLVYLSVGFRGLRLGG